MLRLAVLCCTALSYRDIRYRDPQIPTPQPPLTAMGKRPKGRSRLPLKGNAMGVAWGSPALFFSPTWLPHFAPLSNRKRSPTGGGASPPPAPGLAPPTSYLSTVSRFRQDGRPGAGAAILGRGGRHIGGGVRGGRGWELPSWGGGGSGGKGKPFWVRGRPFSAGSRHLGFWRPPYCREEAAILGSGRRHLGRPGCIFWGGCEPPSCGQTLRPHPHGSS